MALVFSAVFIFIGYVVMDSLIDELAARAAGRELTLVMPEGANERVLAAARILVDRNLGEIVLLGSQSDISSAADVAGVDLAGLTLINPADSRHLDAFARQYLDVRPGTKISIARRLVAKPLFFGGSMLRAGMADAMLAGVAHPTAKVIEACLMTVGMADGIQTPSSCFLMSLPNNSTGSRALIYADCAVNVEPTCEQLADIALASAETGRFLLREQPRVAFLSFSSKGSGNHRLARKMADAATLAATRAPEVAIDGELQADAALVQRVAAIKLAPAGKVAGRANVLIFPDLNAGNIAYKLTQYLAGASALGPLLQGFSCPVADLSRGASVDDIVDTAIVTLARAATSSGRAHVAARSPAAT
jgi:phosphate acetyltransferase